MIYLALLSASVTSVPEQTPQVDLCLCSEHATGQPRGDLAHQASPGLACLSVHACPQCMHLGAEPAPQNNKNLKKEKRKKKCIT